MNDRHLLQRLRQGDGESFDVIFRQNYPAMVGLAESMLRDRDAAEEVAQDVMLELWRRRETLSIDESFRAYLLRATRNRSLNHLRHRKVMLRSAPYLALERETMTGFADDGTASEIDAAVRSAVAGLPDRCREIFELSRVNGLQYKEIATTLEISVKTVEAQMGKALRTLREALADWLPGR